MLDSIKKHSLILKYFLKPSPRSLFRLSAMTQKMFRKPPVILKIVLKATYDTYIQANLSRVLRDGHRQNKKVTERESRKQKF
jgi:hypothetical protein